jgi:hypothetical protein
MQRDFWVHGTALKLLRILLLRCAQVGMTSQLGLSGSIVKPLLLYSIQESGLVRAVQGERRYLDIKMFSALRFHLVGATHHSPRRVERRAACVFKALARLENRLLPDNTRSLDLSQLATSIRDHPVAAKQMDRFMTVIFDDHPVGPKILRGLRR